MSRLSLIALFSLGLVLPAFAAEKEHLRIDIDGPLPPAKAEEVYNKIKGEMADGYAPAQDAVIKAYPRWQRFNIAPICRTPTATAMTTTSPTQERQGPATAI